MLGNRNVGASIIGLDFNTHTKSHLCRGALEGIAFSLMFGMELLKSEGIEPKVIRAGNDNMFRSVIFAQTVANLIEQEIEIYDNTGATGAARACGLVNGDFEAYGLQVEERDFIKKYIPDLDRELHRQAYHSWKWRLEELLSNQQL